MDIKDLKKKALEKLGSEEKAQAFIDGFVETILKEASFMDHDLSNRTVGTEVIGGIAGGAAKSVGGAVGGAAVKGIVHLLSGASKLGNYSRFLQSLEKAISMNKVLKGAPKAKVMDYAETIYNFAPSVATDPNMLSSILANAIHGDGIDPMTIRTLTELDSRYREGSFSNPRNFT